jgi:pyruvate/2-oxoacid:ferredoxin oxidoreductase beta subunit
MSERITRIQVPALEIGVTPGSACQGCGAALAARLAFKALGPKAIRLSIPCCPDTITNHPMAIGVFEGGGAHLSGISRGLKAMGRSDVTAVGFFGDGGTYDIGFQGLSAAAERNENIFVITKDNEAYMNTGNQRSGSTPKYARTSTNPVGPKSRGKAMHKKRIPQIFAAHGVPYVATASVAFPEDLIAKVNYAKEIVGFKMIIIQSPCPVGWRYLPNLTIEVARTGVQSGVWPLYEIVDGQDFKLNYKPKELKPVSEYLKVQGRFRHMTEEEITDIQDYTTARWEQLLRADELKKLIM